MPIGIIINSLSVIVGGLLGFFLRDRISEKLRSSLPITFGVVSIAMGITSIQKINYLPAVVLSVIIGNVLGEIMQMECKLTFAVQGLVKRINRSRDDTVNMDTLIGIIVLFCASGTGIYGAMESGLTGDHSSLFTKSPLDFFTSMIFGTILGGIVSLIAIPQFILLLSVFLTAGLILPHVTTAMIQDFTACGGILMIATGLRIGEIKRISIVNMLPALVIALPVSYLFSLLSQ